MVLNSWSLHGKATTLILAARCVVLGVKVKMAQKNNLLGDAGCWVFKLQNLTYDTSPFPLYTFLSKIDIQMKAISCAVMVKVWQQSSLTLT